MSLKKHLEKLRTIHKKKYHPLLHVLHKKHKISKRTLFYVKEYGPHTNVPKTIIKESIKIVLLASLISSLGGLALEHIRMIFAAIIPLLILLPTLNDMVGDYGTIVSSKFSTMLHEGKITAHWLRNKALRKLFVQIIIIASLTASISAGISFLISTFSGYTLTRVIAMKLFFLVLLDTLLLVSVLFLTAVIAGLHFYKHHEDPNNFLIPITTAVADFGNMFILALLVMLLF